MSSSAQRAAWAAQKAGREQTEEEREANREYHRARRRRLSAQQVSESALATVIGDRSRARARAARSLAAQMRTVGVRQTSDGERQLRVACWCEQREVWVDAEAVRRGITWSCGTAGCGDQARPLARNVADTETRKLAEQVVAQSVT